jgi:hypothetical protein
VGRDDLDEAAWRYSGAGVKRVSCVTQVGGMTKMTLPRSRRIGGVGTRFNPITPDALQRAPGINAICDLPTDSRSDA